ncbi:MAG TPA: PrpR N-terminal domain-containing protein [Mobilitalea sp.]|nr:PrpR N-terminal domain-containing protein [Mobilitalea sp.]
MERVKILGIAPYDGIKSLMLQIAEKRKDIELNAFTGDLNEGLAIAQRYEYSGYDVIVSRGGTAELIRQHCKLPVVDITLSIYDIFRSIKLAENSTNKYVVIGFPAITKNAHFICDMLQYNINIYTIHNEQEASEILKKLSAEGYDMVLCDMITSSLAQKLGMTAILITSGSESIEAAFDLAIQMSKAMNKIKQDVNFYKMVLENTPKPFVVFDEKFQQVYYCGEAAEPVPVMEEIRKHLPTVLNEGSHKSYIEYSGLLYVLNGNKHTQDDQIYLIYYINHRKVPLALTKNGIYHLSKEEAYDKFFNSFYGITQSTQNNLMSIEQYAESTYPVMIMGERGTGKEQLARLLYAKSKLQNSPLTIIDCARINPRSWEFLTGDNNSPLSDTKTTIHIQNMDSLTDPQFSELISIIKDLNLHHRNRILFTISVEKEEALQRCERVINNLSCLTLRIPPLREHKEDIPNLASLYISVLNMRFAKEIVGLEPDAMKLLQNYNWPFNYDQFKRILNELVSSASSSYITTSAVSSILCKELSDTVLNDNGKIYVNLNQSLEQINMDIIKILLNEEKNNQSNVAKKLDISRTTLWRMMQKMGISD